MSVAAQSKIALYCLIALIAAGGFIFGFAVLLFVFVEAEKPLPADEVDLASLLTTWESNPVAVIEQHRGKAVRVTGYVKEISSNIHGQTYLLLTTKKTPTWKDRSFQVFLLRQNLIRQMKDHPVGTEVTVEVVLEDSPHSSPRGPVQRIARDR